MSLSKSLLLCIFMMAACTTVGANGPKDKYVDWRRFKAQGVNLGGWLVQEANIDPDWWTQNGGTFEFNSTEWSLCQNLGSQCGPVLEERYSSWITEADIDKLARQGAVNILRIPTTYAAWLRVPGSQLYTGNQTKYLSRIAKYAIEQYDMHIIIDVHSLPGGINGLTIGENFLHWGWFFNATNLEYSFKVIDEVVAFIQKSGHPDHFTIEPINEPADNTDLINTFGTPAALTPAGAEWVKLYFDGVISRVAAVNPRIPVMLQTFKPETFWSSRFPASANIVFDAHSYYFLNSSVNSANLTSVLPRDAAEMGGDGKFPVFVGEWSIATGGGNLLAHRENNFKNARRLFNKHTQGNTMWTAKHFGGAPHGITPTLGEGVEGDYWSFDKFIDLGFLD